MRNTTPALCKCHSALLTKTICAVMNLVIRYSLCRHLHLHLLGWVHLHIVGIEICGIPDLPLMSLALRLRALRAIKVSVELVGW